MANEKVMVVEDEKVMATSIQDFLEYSGYSVPAVVSSGEDAIKRARELSPDLVLMDIVLEGDVDGVTAAWTISNQYDIPVIYLTALDDAITLKRVDKTSPSGYLTKPFKVQELQVAIEIALQRDKFKKRQKETHMAFNAFQQSIHLATEALSFSKVVKNEFTNVQIIDIISEILEIAKETFPQTIEIEADVPEDLWPVSGNSGLLYKVVMNLCTYAHDAMGAGGGLSLSAENVFIAGISSIANIDSNFAPYIAITVSDTGKSFSMGEGGRVFDLFFTAEDLDKTNSDSSEEWETSSNNTGPGLETTLGIVKKHGGFLSVHFKPGNGTKVKVYLPSKR